VGLPGDTPNKKEAGMKATQGEWVVEYGAVYASSSESSTPSRLLLADRDNPQTQPTERDANVLLAAEAVNFVRRLEKVFGPIVDADEWYPGSDAVDDIAELVTKAREILQDA